jgi:hypothetical protein
MSDYLREQTEHLKRMTKVPSSSPSHCPPGAWNLIQELWIEIRSLRAEQDNAGFIPWRLAQDSLDDYAEENERLRGALSHDREVCGREEGLCWKCRALEGGAE